MQGLSFFFGLLEKSGCRFGLVLTPGVCVYTAVKYVGMGKMGVGLSASGFGGGRERSGEVRQFFVFVSVPRFIWMGGF